MLAVIFSFFITAYAESGGAWDGWVADSYGYIHPTAEEFYLAKAYTAAIGLPLSVILVAIPKIIKIVKYLKNN